MNLSGRIYDIKGEAGRKKLGGRRCRTDDFTDMIAACRGAVERFVRYKIPSKYDADDVLQETYLSAHQSYSTLKDQAAFKPWIIGIARHKCDDYYRKRGKIKEIPLEEIREIAFFSERFGANEDAVRETLNALDDKDKALLYQSFILNLKQKDIASRLGVPVGTVKSRLHAAKQKFMRGYAPDSEGETFMKKMPEYLPEYEIEKSEKAPFPVVWEELMGWFLVPKLGEKLSWGMYDMPSRKYDHFYDMAVTGKAEVHGIEGVEMTARESGGSCKIINRTFVAQLTDTHCRYLASLRTENGVRKYITFLDGDAFLQNWGFGEDNCGSETHIHAKGDITREGSIVRSADKSFLLDIVGRYNVKINGKEYDTVCVMDVECYNPGVVSEQYLDRNGRTILWRRFNRDDWAFDHYQQKWSEKLPDNERLTINGAIYVHWYDCITDYIL